MKCPVCRNRKCKWIDLTDKQIKRADAFKLRTVIDHNIDYIDMLGRGGQISANAEERMYSMLEPLEDEFKIKLKKGKT